MDKLFVYGIFLDEDMRSRYGMINPRYAVVEGYKTRLIRDGIVEAVPDSSGALTGLIVDIPSYVWKWLDILESGYDRTRVSTTDGEDCWMYVAGTY